ncbi:MAG: hypothetical protein ACO3QS_06870 [Burkholderiaceae bacterium]
MRWYDFGPLWPRQHADRWIAGYALAFFLAYWANVGIRGFFEVIPDFVYLIYLPAFIRVVAVATAGLAGVLGVALGHLLTQLVFKEWAPQVILLTTLAGALAPLAALLLVRKWRSDVEINACPKTLAVFAVLTCFLNVLFRALVWQLTGEATPAPTLPSMGLLLMGNLGGVALGYLVLRSVLLLGRRLSSW